jgi:hypothetical protein
MEDEVGLLIIGLLIIGGLLPIAYSLEPTAAP